MTHDPVIHPTVVIAAGVRLGSGSTVGAFVALGEGSEDGPDDARSPLVIGDDAMIRSHTVLYGGSTMGARFQTGHGVLVREGCRIGDDVSVGSHSVVEHHVRIGHRVRLHSGVFVPEFSQLEDDAWLGPDVVLTNARYPRSAGVKERLEGPRIMKNAKIGANATVLPGITIGADALVGAGSVVTRDVEPGHVVIGNPARPRGRTGDIEAYKVLHGASGGSA